MKTLVEQASTRCPICGSDNCGVYPNDDGTKWVFAAGCLGCGEEVDTYKDIKEADVGWEHWVKVYVLEEHVAAQESFILTLQNCLVTSEDREQRMFERLCSKNSEVEELKSKLEEVNEKFTVLSDVLDGLPIDIEELVDCNT